MDPQVCVVFTARERYAHAVNALKALYSSSAVPFRLVAVDAGMPARYRRLLERELDGRPGAELRTCASYLYPNQARNRGAAGAAEEYLFFIENDCSPRAHCLERLLAEARRSAAVAVPLLWEAGRRHHDLRSGSVRELDGGAISIEPDRIGHELPAAPRRVELFENHCFLMPRRAYEASGGFDEELNSREFLDLSLSMRRAGVPAVLVPQAEVDFYPPPPIARDELANYRKRWDRGRVAASNERVRARWRIADMPDSNDFAWKQQLRVSRWTWLALRVWRALGRRLRMSGARAGGAAGA